MTASLLRSRLLTWRTVAIVDCLFIVLTADTRWPEVLAGIIAGGLLVVVWRWGSVL